MTHMALANLPMVPNVIPSTDEQRGPRSSRWRRFTTWSRPTIDPKTNGRFGQIDILAGPDEALYYRVFGRGKDTKGELRAAGSVEKGKPIPAFGGGATMPMTITFRGRQISSCGDRKADLRAGRAAQGQDGQGHCRLSRRDDRGERDQRFLAQRSMDLDPPPPRYVTFENAVYEVRFDADRRPLGFELKLDDFDMGFEPGTEQATKFVSQVELTDPSSGIKKQPHTISMNNPLDHRGFTFYQSRYIRISTRRPTSPPADSSRSSRWPPTPAGR